MRLLHNRGKTMNISFFGGATLIMDASALFVLAGMIVYTSLYRKRARTVYSLLPQLSIPLLSSLFSECVCCPGMSEKKMISEPGSL